MRENYWSVFMETGDPMLFLLCKVAEESEKSEKPDEKKKKESEKPSQSVM